MQPLEVTPTEHIDPQEFNAAMLCSLGYLMKIESLFYPLLHHSEVESPATAKLVNLEQHLIPPLLQR